MSRRKRKKKPLLPIRYCANCSRPLRSGGARPADPAMPRFCMDPECQSVKKARYHRMKKADLADAPTRCECCDVELPPRKVRRGDSPYGRWCRKPRCQQNRDTVHEMHARTTPSTVEADLTMEFAAAAIDPERALACPDCGLASAVVGFIHPARDADGNLTACRAVGEKAAPRALASLKWPEFFGREV